MTPAIEGPLGKAVRTLRNDGPIGVARRLTRVAYRRLDVAALDQSLLPVDIADSTALHQTEPVERPQRSRPLRVGWVTTPPALGSGGHTTMFRMIEAMESAGHVCTLLLYDRHSGDLESQTEIIRQGWPRIRAEVRSVTDGFAGLDACVATSWPTAHVIARHAATTPLQRFYFIQDFEPYFYPRGSEYALAEDSYRLGLSCIALGHMVADQLTAIGVVSDVVEFGCDTDVYRLSSTTEARSGVVFYTRPGVGRRGFEIGCLALEAFHHRHPDQTIHIYGDTAVDLPFPVQRHSRMSTNDLNGLYNRVIAGLAMSFTNISLVAEEMLAAGCLPVVNDSDMARADLANPHAVWAPPTPHGLAEALSSAVSNGEREARARAAAESVVGRTWDRTGNAVRKIIERATYAG